MEVKKASASAPAIKWALIGLVTSIIITYALQFLNADPNSATKYIGLIPFIAFLLLAQKEYKDQLGGYLTFGEGFVCGFLYAVFLGVLSAVFIYLYYAVLSPEMLAKLLASTQSELEKKNPNMTPEQVDQAMAMTSKFLGPISLSIFSLLGTLFMGAIVALVGAAIFKKVRPPFITSADYDDPKPLDPAV